MWGTSDRISGPSVRTAGTTTARRGLEDAVAPPVTGNADQTVWGNSTDYFAGGGYIALYHWTSAAPTGRQECIAPGYGGSERLLVHQRRHELLRDHQFDDRAGLVQRCTERHLP